MTCRVEVLWLEAVTYVVESFPITQKDTAKKTHLEV
jgi:hypothetical protein